MWWGAPLAPLHLPLGGAPHWAVPQQGCGQRQNSSGSDFLTNPLPVDNLSHRCLAIWGGGRGWGRLGRGPEAGIEEAICEVGVLLQVSVARAHIRGTNEPMKERPWGCSGLGWGLGVLTHLQGVLIALGLRTTPGHVEAALEVAQDQLPDDVLVGLLEQLLKQPQRGDADLGPEGVSRMPFLPWLLGAPGVCSPR